jgi:hypothetical protein
MEGGILQGILVILAAAQDQVSFLFISPFLCSTTYYRYSTTTNMTTTLTTTTTTPSLTPTQDSRGFPGNFCQSPLRQMRDFASEWVLSVSIL